MEGFLNRLGTNGLKYLIIIKIVVITAIILSYMDINIIYLGDRILAAKENNEEPKKVAAAKKVEDNRGTDDDVGDDEGETSKRKSYLEDILSLPKLETEKLTKEEINRYITLIERKKGQIDERMRILKDRERHLISLEQTIDKKISKFEDEMILLKGTLQNEKKIKDERLNQLVDIYTKMTPKKAAPIFEKMDKDLVVALFNKLPKKLVTQFLTLMNPEKSVEISEYYGRIKSGTEYEFLREINNSLKKEFEICRGMPAETAAAQK
ncbi:MAG: hypothetical protein HQK54_02785 [Oligoflexales bacterium]|nr:hypothetical protein [Oligoflexales bacterium]